jgi:threonine dehydratase
MSFATATYCISLDDVKEAAKRIEGVAHRTPVLTSSSFDSGGRHLFFKVEAMQRTGSFKFRGALNAVKAKVANTSCPSLSVVTHSSGNHAAALALAAKLASTEETCVTATIVMPHNAPDIKKAGVKGFCGTTRIVSVDNTNEARETEADRIVAETGGVFVHPSEDPLVIAGQGTVSLELVAQVKALGYDLDAVIIPVGGGGLASGNTVALRGLLGNKVKVGNFFCSKERVYSPPIRV